MVSDKTLHKAFRIQKTINKTHKRNFCFHYLPKLYNGFNHEVPRFCILVLYH